MAEYRDPTHLTETERKNINLLATAIRQKMYGIDVREAIALAIELTFDTLAKENNDAYGEVVQARGVWDTLEKRLDNLNVNDINKNLGKIDQTYLTDELLEQIAGTAPINAVPADGSLTTTKYANSSVTGEKIADGSISRPKTNYYSEARESVDLTKLNLISGGYYGSTGVWVDSSTYSSIEVPVQEGETYFREGAYSTSGTATTHLTFWNASGEFISGNQLSNFPVPENAKIARITIYPESINNGSAKLFKILAIDTGLVLGEGNFSAEISKGIINRQNASWYEYTDEVTNMLSQASIIPGEYYNANGTLISDNTRSMFELKITSGNKYTKEDFGYNGVNNTFNTFWDEQGGFIQGNQNETFEVPEGASIVRLAISNALIENAILYPSGNKFKVIDPNLKISNIDGISNLNGLKWNALGDSITFGAGTSKTYVDIIADRTGAVPTNYGVSGTTITSVENPNGEGMVTRYANMSDDADIITVFAGTNDMSLQAEIGTWGSRDTTTVYGATTVLVEGLYTKYVGKKIGFILPIPRWTVNGEHTHGLENYVAAIKDVCDRYSIPTLDLYHGSGLMPGIAEVAQATMPDLTHPNEKGHEIIATKIQRFLESL